MIPSRAGCAVAMILAASVGFMGGCAGGKEYRAGWKAERRGEFHVAYDLYCKAAEKSPSNRVISAAVARVAPKAARYWEDKAHEAVKAGRYDEAWRLFMRVLEIRPDHPSAAHLIRRLEREHPERIAEAKRQWLRAGPVALAEAPRHAPDKPSTGSQPRTVTSHPTRPLAYAGPERLVPSSSRRPSVESAEARPKARAEPRSRPVYGIRPAGDFLVVHTISREDRRYSKIVEAIDGLFVKVKDTDPRPLDADLEIYLGDKRIREFKDLKVGDSRVVTGRSGRWYRLVILKIFDDKETVRFGILPAE